MQHLGAVPSFEGRTDKERYMSADVAAPPRGCLSMHNDWHSSCWMYVLPRHQSFMLAMLFGTAAVRGLEGDLDEIAVQAFGKDTSQYRLGDAGLDSPLAWVEEEDLEDAATEEEAAQLRAGAEEHRRWVTQALRSAVGQEEFSTVRDLAVAMERLRIVERSGSRWEMPETLPRPEDALALPDDLLATLRRIREHQAVEPAEQALMSYFDRKLGQQERASTSLERLGRATGFTTDEVRAALDYLARPDGALEIALLRGQPPTPVNAQALEPHTRFDIALDWQRVNDNRIHIVRGR
ncbi:DUF6042 family protein [Streptomyces olivoreticuli]